MQIGAAMSKEVNFICRMGKKGCCLRHFGCSSAWRGKHSSALLAKCEPAGAYELKGFEGKDELFGC